MATFDPATTALLVVHLQHDIVSPGTAFGAIFSAEAQSRDVVARSRAAMDAVRTAGGTVVVLRIAFADDYSDLAPSIPLLGMVLQAGCLKDGTPGAAVVEALGVQDSDVVVTHHRPGPFTDSDLQQILAGHSVENVVVCGVATNASVEGVVRQAADLGYHVSVLSDASSAADTAAHDASLASMGLFAEHLTVADLSAALS